MLEGKLLNIHLYNAASRAVRLTHQQTSEKGEENPLNAPHNEMLLASAAPRAQPKARGIRPMHNYNKTTDNKLLAAVLTPKECLLITGPCVH